MLVISLLSLTGCDLEDSKYNDLSFENVSRFNVEVIPLTTEWAGFTLAPGERRKFDDIDNPDFTWEPIDKVELGVASTDRDVIFVDRADDFVRPTEFIILESD